MSEIPHGDGLICLTAGALSQVPGLGVQEYAWHRGGGREIDEDTLMEVAVLLHRQLCSHFSEVPSLSLGEVREMLEEALISARAGLIDTQQRSACV